MSLSPSVSRSGSAFHTFKANDVKMETDGEDLLPSAVGMKRKRSSTSVSNSDRRRASTSTSTPGAGVGAVGLAQVPSQASVASEAVSATSVSTPVNANGEGAVKVEGEGDATQGEGEVKKEEVVASVKPELYAEEARRRGRAKGRTEEEVEAMAGVAYRYVSTICFSLAIYLIRPLPLYCVIWFRFATSLASDHHHVLNPDTETPFSDAHDVVKRLLPYHVFLQPRRDLKMLLERPLSELRGYSAFRVDGKGKGKATEEELAREEIRGAWYFYWLFRDGWVD